MSGTFSLSVPTDIPWKRICVTKDMLDPVPCDAERPPRWRSSIAIFRYDPTEEYQPYDDLIVSYLKVAVTVAPFAPEIGVDFGQKYVPPIQVDELEEAFPCYGALLHVLVAPDEKSRGRFTKEQYPYFIDFEPKKRELYEMVTDTGEVLSGSSSTLSLGKSSVSSQTTENYNLDTGWNFGLSASYLGTGGGVSAGSSGQYGTVSSSGYQTTNLRSSDVSTERRELQSHTTQLSQMYNLFQAFHLGTNRALFFMEPRPHIRQAEATFINGPRALEGIQEIFLAVVRPKDMQDFCVAAVLETAHLTKKPVLQYEEGTDVVSFRLTAKAENRDTSLGQDSFTSDPVSDSITYYPPDGWEIVGIEGPTVLQSQRGSDPAVTWDANVLTAYGEVTWRFYEEGWKPFEYIDHYEDGILNYDVKVKIRKKDPDIVDYTESLFLSARNLCCCPHERRGEVEFPTVVYERRLAPVARVEMYHGFGSRRRLKESRVLAQHIRTEMIRSFGSRLRYPIGKVAYRESNAFLTRVAGLWMSRMPGRDLQVPLSKSKLLEDNDRLLFEKVGADPPLQELLTMDGAEIASRLSVPDEQAVALKARLLASMREKLRPRVERTERTGRVREERPIRRSPKDEPGTPPASAS